MSKRFTDTSKWTDPWFRKLESKYKLLWLYLLDNCDIAGVWRVDIELASFIIGEDLDKQQAIDYYQGYITPIHDGASWHVLNHVKFQCGNVLKHGSNAHLSVIRQLEEHGLLGTVQVQYPNSTPTVPQQYPNSTGTVHGEYKAVAGTLHRSVKDKDKDKDTDKEKDKEEGGMGETIRESQLYSKDPNNTPVPAAVHTNQPETTTGGAPQTPVKASGSLTTESERLEARLATAAKHKPFPDEYEAHCAYMGFPKQHIEPYYQERESNGWLDYKGMAIVNWKYDVMRYMQHKGWRI